MTPVLLPSRGYARYVRVDILSKEYPPRSTAAPASTWPSWWALRARDDVEAECTRSARHGTRRVRRLRRPGRAGHRQRRPCDPRRRPRHRRRCAGADSSTPTRGMPTWPARRPPGTACHTSSRCTRSSRCGRGRPSSSAAATASRPGRAHRLRVRRRGDRRLGGMRTTCCGASPPSTPSGFTWCTTASTPSYGRSRRRPRARSHGVDPDRPAVSSSAASPARRGCRYLLRAVAQLARSRSRWCSAPARPTPPRSRPRWWPAGRHLRAPGGRRVDPGHAPALT